MGQKLGVSLFFVFLGSFSLGNLYYFNPESLILDRENRMQKPWPGITQEVLADGTWPRNFEEFYNDRFLFRQEAMEAAGRIRSHYGLPQGGVEIVAASAGDQFDIPPEKPKETITPEIPVPVLTPPQETWDKQLIVLGDRAYETAGYEENAVIYYTKALDSLKKSLGSHIRVFSLMVPSAIEFLEDPAYKKLTFSQREGIKKIQEKLSPDIISLSALPLLEAHKSEYIYHHTDHHWTALGAYYAYTALGPTLGFTPHNYGEYPKETVEGFLGTLYNQSLSPSLKAAPDTMEIVYPFADHEFDRHRGEALGKAVDLAYVQGFNKYLTYIAGDDPWSEIRSSVKNGKKILVIKDSYGNALIPYLIPHYEEIHIVDPRYYQGKIAQLVQEKGIADVLVVNYYLVVSFYKGFARNLLRVSGE